MPKKLADYAADLEVLLDEALAAVTAKDPARMRAARDALRAFLASSDNLLPGVIELDQVALGATQDLTLAIVGQNVAVALGARSAEVARLAKTFHTQAGVNASEASKLRLERVKAVLDATTTAVGELRRLGELLSDDSRSDAAALAAIESAVGALLGVQKKLAV